MLKNKVDKVKLAIIIALEKKVKDLIVLDMKKVSSIADYFLICSGKTARQVKGIATAIIEGMEKKKYRAMGIEGMGEGNWILLDYEDLVIDVMLDSIREFYDLERLWSDAP